MACRSLSYEITGGEGVNVKTRMDRLGHTHDAVNIVHSRTGDQAQLAASETVWQKLKTARSEPKQEPTDA